jgi:hypothetical protein
VLPSGEEGGKSGPQDRGQRPRQRVWLLERGVPPRRTHAQIGHTSVEKPSLNPDSSSSSDRKKLSGLAKGGVPCVSYCRIRFPCPPQGLGRAYFSNVPVSEGGGGIQPPGRRAHATPSKSKPTPPALYAKPPSKEFLRRRRMLRMKHRQWSVRIRGGIRSCPLLHKVLLLPPSFTLLSSGTPPCVHSAICWVLFGCRCDTLSHRHPAACS